VTSIFDRLDSEAADMLRPAAPGDTAGLGEPERSTEGGSGDEPIPF
jgi:hypothetical protein